MEEFSRKYFDLLTGEYQGINLTRIIDYNEFYHKQILDSIEPLEKSDAFKSYLSKTNCMVDVGFGGGFPLLPMAFLNPDMKFIGIETRKKKADVVREIALKLGINNVSFIHSRIENVLIDFPVLVTLKAVGKVHDFLNKINTNQNLQVYFYKGPNFYSIEADQIKETTKEWRIVEEKELFVEGTDKRLLIGFENKNVRRGTTDAKNLVKLSKLILK